MNYFTVSFLAEFLLMSLIVIAIALISLNLTNFSFLGTLHIFSGNGVFDLNTKSMFNIIMKINFYFWIISLPFRYFLKNKFKIRSKLRKTIILSSITFIFVLSFVIFLIYGKAEEKTLFYAVFGFTYIFAIGNVYLFITMLKLEKLFSEFTKKLKEDNYL